MKKFFVFATILLMSSLVFAADWEDLTQAQQSKFGLAVLKAASNLEQSPSDRADQAIADWFIARQDPPYYRIWELVTVIDNSGMTCGENAFTSIDVDVCTSDQMVAISAGPLSQMGRSVFRELEGVAVP